MMLGVYRNIKILASILSISMVCLTEELHYVHVGGNSFFGK